MYQSLQRDYRLAPYLEKLSDPRARQILSRYRLSAHNLAIEVEELLDHFRFKGWALSKVRQSFKHLGQVFQVVFMCLGEDDDIIQVQQDDFKILVPETALHRSLECSWCLAQSERHAYFVCPVEGRAKHCSAQAPGLSELSRHLPTGVLCSALNRADKVRLRRSHSHSMKTRRRRHRKKIGGPGPDRYTHRTWTSAGPPLGMSSKQYSNPQTCPQSRPPAPEPVSEQTHETTHTLYSTVQKPENRSAYAIESNSQPFSSVYELAGPCRDDAQSQNISNEETRVCK
ncbi:unnamed protein product [Ranitomeya imitator]|uniref:Uncharacterized protein n=1 Tax=Ranitomeya imitator TaxID=111125 RepID=A0ABN9LY67_9NEOB|nr:unnamed protein product [Ranitomeya imitator]